MKAQSRLICIAIGLHLTTDPANSAVIWNEAVDGDIASSVTAPTFGPTFDLLDGVNEVFATTSFQQNGDRTFTGDVDWFYIVVPTGSQLVAASLQVGNPIPFSDVTSQLGIGFCRVTGTDPGWQPILLNQGGIRPGELPCAISYVAPGIDRALLLQAQLWQESLPLGAGTYGVLISPYISCATLEFCGGSTDFHITFEILTDPVSLAEGLQALVDDKGPGSSLSDKIAQVRAYLEVPDVDAACSLLGAFRNQIGAQTGKRLAVELAAQLQHDAARLKAILNCD